MKKEAEELQKKCLIKSQRQIIQKILEKINKMGQNR